MTHCPLCQGAQISDYSEDGQRPYLNCKTCNLVFVPDEYHLSPEQERSIYDQHQNSPDDLGYRKFLARLFDPLITRLPQQAEGLDFGCGPGPTLSIMLEESGHTVSQYDKFYAPEESLLYREYDFITATEVFEHLHNPLFEIARLLNCLRPGGILGIMTKLVLGQEAFRNWHYKNDPTHICFFSQTTFDWLSTAYQLRSEFIGNDVILLQHRGHPKINAV